MDLKSLFDELDEKNRKRVGELIQDDQTSWEELRCNMVKGGKEDPFNGVEIKRKHHIVGKPPRFVLEILKALNYQEPKKRRCRHSVWMFGWRLIEEIIRNTFPSNLMLKQTKTKFFYYDIIAGFVVVIPTTVPQLSGTIFTTGIKVV